jgi:lipid II:glycine glycyltransferase (peptidoglycan interpeptide bridge formation enzyme)
LVEGNVLTLHLVNELDHSTWRDFVQRNPMGNIFHTPEMFAVFQRADGHLPKLWAIVDETGQPYALLTPVEIILNRTLRLIATRAVVYGSVLFDPGSTGVNAVKMLLTEYQKVVPRRVLFVELRNLTDLGDIQPDLNECGFFFEDHLNYLINLARPVEAIFEDIGPRTRKNIRRGLNREKVQIDVLEQRDQLLECYQLIAKTYQAAGIPLAHPSLFEAAFDILHPKGMIRFTMARVDQQLAAVSVELLYNQVVYGWYSGLDRNYASYVPNELIMWHILKWSAEQGFHTYDFGGAGKPSEKYGVRDFKAKFGGKLVNYGRYKLIISPLVYQLGEAAFNVGKRLRIWN